MRTKILQLVCTFVFSIGVIGFLFYYNTYKSFLNNFVRKLTPYALGISDLIDIRYSNFYFAGASDSLIYLGNASAPLYIFSADPLLKDTTLLKLRPEKNDSMRLKTAMIRVRQNRVYLLDGVTPAIYESTPKQGAIFSQTSGHDNIYFTDIVPFSPSSFAIRTFDGISRQNVLARKIVTNKTHLEPADGVLQKQVDGIFCTDGNLLYSETSARLVYLYRYRNEFICMDTGMHILYRGHTIDTTTHARIKVDSIASEHSITMAAPPNAVNRMACVYKNWLFVNSNLTADNENRDTAKDSSVIDVYTLNDGAYQFSFYLFNIGGYRVHSIGAAYGRLFAVHGHFLIAYTLEPKYFNEQNVTLATQ